MIFRFTRLFKKTDPDELRAFQRRVLLILRELHPDRPYAAGDDPMIVTLDKTVIGLGNIHANFLLGSQSDFDLRELVTMYVSRVETELNDDERTRISWLDASPLLRPQLMPESYLEKMDLVSKPFGGGIVLGFVVDDAETYSYVTRKDADRWVVSDDEIQQLAVENLNVASRGIELTLFPEPNAFAAIDTLDGYDAARIVVQGIRNILAEDLGYPFHFAVPNRDFLICWTTNCEMEFADEMRTKVSQDFGERPYPLSASVFAVSAEGEFIEVETKPATGQAGQSKLN